MISTFDFHLIYMADDGYQKPFLKLREYFLELWMSFAFHIPYINFIIRLCAHLGFSESDKRAVFLKNYQNHRYCWFIHRLSKSHRFRLRTKPLGAIAAEN